jgi:hypothetical protein
MTEVNIFEEATRSGLTFEYKGTIGVEDLWDLPLTALDSIYKSLKATVKQSEEGLLNTRTSKDKELELKIAVVTRVFEVKQDELNEKKLASEKREKKQKLMAALERKQDSELEAKTPAEIQTMIDEL